MQNYMVLFGLINTKKQSTSMIKIKLHTLQFCLSKSINILIVIKISFIRSRFFSTFFAREPSRSVPVAIIAMPISLFIVTFRARETFRNIKLLIFAHPVSLLIIAFRTREPFCHIPITIQTSPISLFISTFARESFGVIEVTVIASPASFFIAAFARETFGNIPPVGRVAASSTSLHGVSSWIAKMACCTGPVCLLVLAGITREPFFNSFLAILAIPLHSINFMLITEQIWLIKVQRIKKLTLMEYKLNDKNLKQMIKILLYFQSVIRDHSLVIFAFDLIKHQVFK